MASYAEMELADGTAVRFEVSPGTGTGGGGLPDGAGELPPGTGDLVPVAGGGLAVGALRRTLRPLGPLLQEVHDAIAAAPSPPHEVSVTFGVEVGQDLKLGIVGAAGKAHLTVSATWHPTPPPTAPGTAEAAAPPAT
ncbi:CU044_2847 family protein [Streptomyces sp. NPDC021224]|uniref:CU044_2847 family protein n=1 Tax=unclassified Streptomyces TaxID=2593676 RepID=UPI0037AFB2AC